MLCATASCRAQVIRDGRWTLRPDSIVEGIHYIDVVHMEATRRLYKHQRESYKQEASACGEETRSLRDLIDAYIQEQAISDKKIDLLLKSNAALEQDNEALVRKTDRLRPWATVGRVATFSVGLGVVGVGVAAGIRAIHSR